MKRVETGPLQIRNDWPGVFIRGDNALMKYAPALRALIDGTPGPFDVGVCESLVRLLQSCQQGCDTQKLPVDRVDGE